MNQLKIDQSVQTALQHHQSGRLNEAERIYRTVLAVNPRHPDALHLLGLVAGQKGQHREAVNLISRAIEVIPNNPSFHCNLGVFLQYSGQLDKAVVAYQQAAALKPDYVEAFGNLGIVLFKLGQMDLAIVAFQRAVALRPDAFEFHLSLGNAWRSKREFANAIFCYQRALALNPNYIEARFNLGIAHGGAGELEKAAACFQEVVTLNPGDPGALCSLGTVLDESGSLHQAIAFFERAIQIAPDYTEAYGLLANSLNQLGEFDKAVDTCKKALQINPQYAEGYSNLGLALAGKRDFGEAIEAYRRAIDIDPDLLEAYCNLAYAHADIREFDRAIEYCKAAIARRRDFADAHACLATVYLARGQYDQSVASNLKAISIRPNSPEVYCNLGLAFSGLGQVDRAIESYRRAIEQRPDLAEAYNNLGNALKDKAQLAEAMAAYQKAVEVNPRYTTAADNLLYTIIFDPAADEQKIFEHGQRWNRQQAEPLRGLIQPHKSDRNPDRPLRIGYVSPDFCEHPVGRFMLALVIAHNPERFQIFCYADVRRVDEVTSKFQAHCHAWRNIAGLSDDQFAQTVRDDQIDILVDLSLHMSRNRLLAFARKPAPVQATFAGYPGSTGLAAMDYRISDPYLDLPERDDRYYSEKTIRLPDTFWCDNLMSDDPAVNDPPFGSNGFITFGSLNNLCKVNDRVLRLWAAVLTAVANSRILMLAPEGDARTRLLNQLVAGGVAPASVEFVAHKPRPDYLRIYNRIDIALDTWPYNGHATSFDSFWMGVPVVTLVGPTVAGRAGVSQLTNLGLPELIASTDEQYVQIAAALANDSARLTSLRAGLRDRMRRSPLMDIDRFARGMEDAYRAMWKSWCEGR